MSNEASSVRKKVIAIIGVGPGISRAVALRFAREDFAVALLGRSSEKLEAVEQVIHKQHSSAVTLKVQSDARDPESIKQAFTTIEKELGTPDVLVYNAGAFKVGGILDLNPNEWVDSWKTNCYGGFIATQAVIPGMLAKGGGTILYTGATAALRGGAKFSAFAVGKFGLRALAQSVAREFGPQGIHAAHVIIDGHVDTVVSRFPDKPQDFFLSSDAIADEYWNLHNQNKTTWTLELDLRPYGEKF